QAHDLGIRRAQLVATVGLTLLNLGWWGWFFYQSAAFSGQDIFQLFGLVGGTGPRAMLDFLFSSRYGGVWLVRLGLLVLLGLTWALALGSWRKPVEVEPGPASVKNLAARRNWWWLSA